MTTGQRIKETRKKIGMTQQELGAKLGVSGSMIAQYETEKRSPKFETLKRIAAALGVHWLDIAGDDFHEPMNHPLTDLLPDEFCEFAQFIETCGFAILEDGDNYRIVDGLRYVSVVVTPDELRHLAYTSRATVSALIRSLMDTRTIEVPVYYPVQRQDAPQSTPPPPEGTDTTPTEKPPESP